MFLFIGEERSELARERGITWEDGKLAGKQLFDVLKYCNLDPLKDCEYINWFELDQDLLKDIIDFYLEKNFQIVVMGRKVEKQYKKLNLPYIFIYHPATRGAIRKKEVYCEHVKQQLKYDC